MTSRRICDECGANAGPADVKCRRCGGQLVLRSDDGNSDVMGRRLQIYTQQTEPIVNYYRKRPTFRSIDGTQTPDRVADAMAAAIDSAVETTRSSS
jgi:adenylate kinase